MGQPKMDDQLKAGVMAFVQAGNSKPTAAEQFGVGVITVYTLVKEV